MNSIVKPVPLDYNTKIHFIEELIKDFPFLNVEIQGRTATGRAIFSLSLGNRKNSVIIAGGFHGSEWLTSSYLMLFAEKLCRCVKYGSQMSCVDVRRAFSQLGVTIIPSVNPDSAEIFLRGFEGAGSLRHFASSLGENNRLWNANAMGVDIKRNFSSHSRNSSSPFLKDTSEPCAEGYCGKYGESEAETKALTRLCRLHHFRQCMSLECGRNELLHHGENSPLRSNMMAKILADSCGYYFSQDDDRRGITNFSSWFAEEFIQPAFTIKTDKGEIPLSEESFYKNYINLEEAILLFCLM